MTFTPEQEAILDEWIIQLDRIPMIIGAYKGRKEFRLACFDAFKLSFRNKVPSSVATALTHALPEWYMEQRARSDYPINYKQFFNASTLTMHDIDKLIVDAIGVLPLLVDETELVPPVKPTPPRPISESEEAWLAYMYGGHLGHYAGAIY